MSTGPVSAAAPGQASAGRAPSPLHFTYDGCMALQCFADDPEAEFGDTVAFVDPGDSMDFLTRKIREHQAEHGCAAALAAREPDAADGDALGAVYRERAALVAYLSAAYPSVIGPAPDAEGWAIVYVDTPAGQMSWHVATADVELFGHLRIGDAEWDGHSTEEKYERLAKLIPHALDDRDRPRLVQRVTTDGHSV